MSLFLQSKTLQGLAQAAQFQTSTLLATIPTNAFPQAKAVFRHTGAKGFWYGSYNGLAVSTTSYSFKIGPGEPHQMDNPPTGAITLLASADADQPCAYDLGWKQ
jgi:hypothetical protein